MLLWLSTCTVKIDDVNFVRMAKPTQLFKRHVVKNNLHELTNHTHIA